MSKFLTGNKVETVLVETLYNNKDVKILSKIIIYQRMIKSFVLIVSLDGHGEQL